MGFELGIGIFKSSLAYFNEEQSLEITGMNVIPFKK